MFSVLDAAWRMLDNFRRLQEDAPLVLTPLRTRGLHLVLGNGERDNFHPYALLPETATPPGSAFHTVAGWIAHLKDLKEDTEVLERPNVYDGFFLGGSGDRLNMNLTANLKPSLTPVPFAEAGEKLFDRPAQQPVGLMFLDDFETMLDLWAELRAAGVGDGPMRNLWFALESRSESWLKAQPAGARQAVAAIGQALGEHYCGRDCWSKRLQEGLATELLQKSLQLHWSILKTGLDKKSEKELHHESI